MAFLIYEETVGGGTPLYEKTKPLKPGGHDGLLARHVRTLTEEDARSWKLDAPALLRFAGCGPAGSEHAVLFDGTGRYADATRRDCCATAAGPRRVKARTDGAFGRRAATSITMPEARSRAPRSTRPEISTALRA